MSVVICMNTFLITRNYLYSIIQRNINSYIFVSDHIASFFPAKLERARMMNPHAQTQPLLRYPEHAETVVKIHEGSYHVRSAGYSKIHYENARRKRSVLPRDQWVSVQTFNRIASRRLFLFRLRPGPVSHPSPLFLPVVLTFHRWIAFSYERPLPIRRSQAEPCPNSLFSHEWRERRRLESWKEKTRALFDELSKKPCRCIDVQSACVVQLNLCMYNIRRARCSIVLRSSILLSEHFLQRQQWKRRLCVQYKK